MLVESVEGVSQKTAQDEWPLICSDTFQYLSSENIDVIEDKLHHHPLDYVLDCEITCSSDSGCSSRSMSRNSIVSLTEGKECWNGWLSPMRRSSCDTLEGITESPESESPESPPIIVDVQSIQESEKKHRKKRTHRKHRDKKASRKTHAHKKHRKEKKKQSQLENNTEHK